VYVSMLVLECNWFNNTLFPQLVISLPCESHKESKLMLPNDIFANMFG